MQSFHEAFDRELGCAIDAKTRGGLVTAKGRNVDDVTASLLTHAGQYGARMLSGVGDEAGRFSVGLFNRVQTGTPD